ncbi:response regulator transcription factor [Aquibium microcysteis]|uniref:response regulator transcription factor n=1 Tax=Aquibium microcysteis TaxID=675281 RepID=UPI00165D19D3|nr:response regulator [Aquibium microcysteis]
MTTGTTVYVVDDDDAVRASIDRLLRSVGHAVEGFPAPQAFLAAPGHARPSCLVLDVRLPFMSGLEFQRDLALRGIDIPIVFITGHGDVPMSVAAMKAGAIEFLTKPFRDQDLIDAVHRGIELDRQRAGARQALDEIGGRHASLTVREREVMAAVVAGLMNKQIAALLDISEVTVKVHRAQVMRKMGATTLPELVRQADRLGLPTPKYQAP